MSNRNLSSTQFANETYAHGLNDKEHAALAGSYEHLAANPPRFLNNCDETCSILHEHLKQQGVKTRIRSGQFVAGISREDVEHDLVPMSRDHTWLETRKGGIIDPTAGQFIHSKPGGYRGDIKPEHYRPL